LQQDLSILAKGDLEPELHFQEAEWVEDWGVVHGC
jgi:hypothetical protein